MRKNLFSGENKRIIYVVTVLAAFMFSLVSHATVASRDYKTVATKAARFFKYKDWPNAAAMYELMLEDSAKVVDTYCHAIVTAAMRELPDYEISLLERAQQQLIPVDSIYSGVRRVSFAMGQTSLYENFLMLVMDRQPWLKRSIEKQLLNYYVFRRNGPKMVEYSRIMLTGAPDNRQYLAYLADGYMLEGDETRGIDVYRKLLSLYPDDYDTLLILGNYYYMKGEKEPALRYLGQADSIKSTPYVKDIILRLLPPRKHRR